MELLDVLHPVTLFLLCLVVWLTYICYTGWIPELLISDLEMIKQFTIKYSDNFTDRREFLLRGMLKHSVIDQKGKDWKRVRSLITPFFSTENLMENSERINPIADNLVQSLQDQVGEELEANHIAGCFTIDLLCSVAFGVEVESLHDTNHPLVQAVRDIVRELNPSNPWFAITSFFPNIGKLLDKCGVTMFKKKTFSHVEQLSKTLIKQKQDGSKEAEDFVSALVDAHKEELDYETRTALGQTEDTNHEGMNDTEIIANAIVFITCGYDTTTTALSFLLYCLATNETCQESLFEEIDQVIGMEEPTYENLQQLLYLDWCVDETLRLYTPVNRVERKCTKASKIGHLTVPEGMVVTVPVWWLHHDPDVWPDPNKFDPRRFSSEITKKRNPLNFLPFGIGPRHCAGMHLALLAIKMAAVKVIQNFKLVPNTQTVAVDLDPSAAFTTAKDGLWFTVEPREETDEGTMDETDL